MYFKQFVVTILLLSVCYLGNSFVNGYGESDSVGRPNWHERLSHVLTNAVRVDPKNYVPKYFESYYTVDSMFLSGTLTKVRPIYYDYNAINGARAHSFDMGSHGCFKHDDCNGTSIDTRLSIFVPCKNGWGENIAAGTPDGLSTTNLLLCDAPPKSTVCVVDGSAGHRINMMGKSHQVVGVGYFYNATSTYRAYWTQDFYYGQGCFTYNSPIHSGSHLYLNSNAEIKFIASWSHAQYAPSQVLVYFYNPANNSVWNEGMGLDLGNNTMGIFQYTAPNPNSCIRYKFVFTANGTQYTYPDTGSLGTATTSTINTCASWTSFEIIDQDTVTTSTTPPPTQPPSDGGDIGMGFQNTPSIIMMFISSLFMLIGLLI